MIYKSFSYEDTINIGESFGKSLKPGDVVALNGDLGVGKTQFVRGILNAFSFNETVTSPTYTIVNEYDADVLVYHFDVYRISSGSEMFDIGFDEYLSDDAISIIEWADNIKDVLPANVINVNISKDLSVSDDYRIIEIIR